MRNVRFGWALAIAIGVYLGLSFASCGLDNRPDVAVEP